MSDGQVHHPKSAYTRQRSCHASPQSIAVTSTSQSSMYGSRDHLSIFVAAEKTYAVVGHGFHAPNNREVEFRMMLWSCCHTILLPRECSFMRRASLPKIRPALLSLAFALKSRLALRIADGDSHCLPVHKCGFKLW